MILLRFRISPKAWDEKMEAEASNPQVSISQASENENEAEEKEDKSYLKEDILNNGETLINTNSSNQLLSVFHWALCGVDNSWVNNGDNYCNFLLFPMFFAKMEERKTSYLTWDCLYITFLVFLQYGTKLNRNSDSCYATYGTIQTVKLPINLKEYGNVLIKSISLHYK